MSDIQNIIHNYALERETITLSYILEVIDLYKDDTLSIKRVINERLDEIKKETESNQNNEQ